LDVHCVPVGCTHAEIPSKSKAESSSTERVCALREIIWCTLAPMAKALPTHLALLFNTISVSARCPRRILSANTTHVHALVVELTLVLSPLKTTNRSKIIVLQAQFFFVAHLSSAMSRDFWSPLVSRQSPEKGLET